MLTGAGASARHGRPERVRLPFSIAGGSAPPAGRGPTPECDTAGRSDAWPGDHRLLRSRCAREQARCRGRRIEAPMIYTPTSEDRARWLRMYRFNREFGACPTKAADRIAESE